MSHAMPALQRYPQSPHDMAHNVVNPTCAFSPSSRRCTASQATQSPPTGPASPTTDRHDLRSLCANEAKPCG
jgi:hypothetical protein